MRDTNDTRVTLLGRHPKASLTFVFFVVVPDMFAQDILMTSQIAF